MTTVRRVLIAVVAVGLCLLGLRAIVSRSMPVTEPFVATPIYVHGWDAILLGSGMVFGGVILFVVALVVGADRRSSDPSNAATGLAIGCGSTLAVLAGLAGILLLLVAFLVKFALLGGPEFHRAPRAERAADSPPDPPR